MKRTPQEARRESIEELVTKTLKLNKLSLSPVSLNFSQSVHVPEATSCFSFLEEQAGRIETITLPEVEASGFVDCVFEGLQLKYSSLYPSLKNIRLANLTVNPIIKYGRKGTGSDSFTDVVLRVEVKKRASADFATKSRSLAFSSFVATLSAFQFYINCEKCFLSLSRTIEDAQKRNRADIIESCKMRLSALTEVNSYSDCQVTRQVKKLK